MTIFLPHNTSMFRSAFDQICQRILQSIHDRVFYTLLAQLIEQIRQHPLFKDTFVRFEDEIAKREEECSKTALEMHEYHWKKLWQYHCKSYSHRKQLVHIKRIITFPTTISISPLHERLGFSMAEFRHHSPFFRFIDHAHTLFQRAHSAILLEANFVTYDWPTKEREKTWHKRFPLMQKKKEEKHTLHLIMSLPKKPTTVQKLNAKIELLSELFSPLARMFEAKFDIPGEDMIEKKSHMLVCAETDFSFCWARLRIVEQCCCTENEFNLSERFFGKWETVRDNAWKAAWQRCEREIIQWASESLRQQLSQKLDNAIYTFLPYDWQICRSDCETYLKSFQQHIHTELAVIECSETNDPDNRLMVTEGTQKANFVMELAQKYWKVNPTASYDDVFNDYLCKCPHRKSLSRSSWERIVRKRKLDPRPPGSKKRGKGKKKLQI
jgi:hypothetical protein